MGMRGRERAFPYRRRGGDPHAQLCAPAPDAGRAPAAGASKDREESRGCFRNGSRGRAEDQRPVKQNLQGSRINCGVQASQDPKRSLNFVQLGT